MDPLQQDVRDAPHQEALTISQDNEKEDEGAETMIDLPEEIVVKIIAMAPFPSIFKAVGLSKAWRARFLPSNKSPEVRGLSEFSTSDSCRVEDEENERGLAASFQMQVISKWCENWETFSPVFIAKDHLVTYGQKSRNWRILPLSFLPKITYRSQHDGRSVNDIAFLQMHGALLYIYPIYISDGFMLRKETYVADILTQRWKQLPTPPKSGRVVCSKVVTNTSLGTYNMIIFSADENFTHHGHDHFSAHVYASQSETWSSVTYGVTTDFFSDFASFETGGASAAYLNGVLYMVTKENGQHLLAFNLAERTLKELKLSFKGENTWVTNWINLRISLLVCNDNRLIIATTLYPDDQMQVLEVDVQSLHLIRLSQGPPAPLREPHIDGRAVSGGNCILFRTHGPGKEKVLQYNLKEDAWSSFAVPALDDYNQYHWIGGSFQPSLSAFVSL